MQRPITLPNIAVTIADERIAKDIGLVCLDCGSKDIVYAIAVPRPPVWPAGAYCYRHLLERCRRSNQIPVPIPADLLDKLRHDLELDPRKRLYFFKEGGKNGV